VQVIPICSLRRSKLDRFLKATSPELLREHSLAILDPGFATSLAAGDSPMLQQWAEEVKAIDSRKVLLFLNEKYAST